MNDEVKISNENELSSLQATNENLPCEVIETESFRVINDKEESLKKIINSDENNLQNVLSNEPQPSTERKHISGNTKIRCNINKKLKETATNVKNLMSSTTERRSHTKDDANSKSANHHHHYKHLISHYNCEKSTEKMYQFSQNQQNLNISMDYRIKTDENGDKSIDEENTNLFLYLDLHGHASKKGVFMYGNHLSNILEAVEVMLLPKLMSLNCHHFHFDACNFSERNMYLK